MLISYKSDRLLVSQASYAKLERFISNPSQALLISGPSGSGKSSLSSWLAAKLLNLPDSSLESSPSIYRAAPRDGKKTISLDSIKEIDHFLNLAIPIKTNKDLSLIKRIILIDDAEKMRYEAQNALLKNLEEPPKDTIFIFTSSDPNQLLPTVRSRLTSHIDIGTIDSDELRTYLKGINIDNQVIEQAIVMSGSLPGLALAIASKSQEHRLLNAAEIARHILSSDLHERLKLVNSLSKDNQLFKDTLFLLQRMARIGLESSDEDRQSLRWKNVLEAVYQSELALKSSVNMKLNLTHLMQHL